MTKLLSFSPEPFESELEFEALMDGFGGQGESLEQEARQHGGGGSHRSNIRSHSGSSAKAGWKHKHSSGFRRRRYSPSSPLIAQPDSSDMGSDVVRWAQSCLNGYLGLTLPVDGVLDLDTRNAIRTFQGRQGLPTTGRIGPKTEAALQSACQPPQQSEPPPSDELSPEFEVHALGGQARPRDAREGRARLAGAPENGAYEVLTEEEVAELGARLLDASSESEFDHLLAATITHGAARAGGSLSPELGSAVGGLLKNIARQTLRDPDAGQTLGLDLEGFDDLEGEFETNLQFVRLASETARNAVEHAVNASPDQAARAALAAAAEIYAPALGPQDGAEYELWPSPAFLIEPFEYDPEMEYFLGGLVQSIGRGISKVAKDVGRTVGKAADTIGKVPVLGDIARAGVGATRFALGPLGVAIDAGTRIARGEKLGRALEGAVKGYADVARDQLKLAEMVTSFVPGIGTGVAAALGAANALAAGKPITEALLSAARSALPGGAIAQAAFDTALNLAKGQNITEALLGAARNRLPGGPAARAAFDAAVALAQGKKLQDAAFAAAGKLIPPSPLAADALSFVRGIANGQNIQSAALSTVGKRTLSQVRSNATLAAPAMKLASTAVRKQGTPALQAAYRSPPKVRNKRTFVQRRAGVSA